MPSGGSRLARAARVASYEVTEKVLSFGPRYHVRANGRPDVLATIKGKAFSATPELTMIKGEGGGEVASMSGNFLRTNFECKDARKQSLGTLVFPVSAFKRGCSLHAGGAEYKVDGGVSGGEFKCTDARGQTVMVIAIHLSSKDKVAVTTSGVLPLPVALFAAVVINQKFFDVNGSD